MGEKNKRDEQTTTERGEEMTKEEMEQVSNETLADYMTPKRGNEFSQAPWDSNVTNHDLAMAEIARRVRNGMYWQPMTEDAVFEDGGKYLLRYDDGSCEALKWEEYDGCFREGRGGMTWQPDEFTDYARITEPEPN